MKIEPQTVSRAVNASFGKFDHFRKARGRFLSQMVGRFYTNMKGQDKEDKRASPMNLLHSAVTTLVPNLVYNEPKTKVRSDILIYRPYAETLELATNFLVKRIDLRMTLRKAIYDAIFMAGFVKTGIASGDQFLTLDGVDVEIGQPYAERVDPDDIVLDPWARDWDEQSFIGNRYRANLDDLIETGLYEPDELIKLSKDYDLKKRSASNLSGSVSGEYDEVQRYVDLCEVYFPREQVIVTLPYYDSGGKADNFLRVADYNGPEKGPYHMLGFTPVSDNLMPVAPASIWYDLHILGNRIARKLARQAERLKRVLAYEGEAQEDVGEIADADDGETVRVNSVNNIKELTFGGAAPDSYQWMEWVKRAFSEQSGNSELLSGTDTNSPTLGQAEILQANTSVRLGDMQGMVYEFTATIARDLGYFLHTDPLIDLPLVKRVNGVDTQVYYTPEMREGTFFDYTFKVEPYSMARPDPNQAVRRKLEFATNVIPAATQAAMMLGPGFNIGAFLKSMAREVQLEEADEWLNDPQIQQWIAAKIQAAMMTGDPGKAGAGQMPAQPAMFNPAQPVPSAMGPQGGISPETEQNQAQQEASGESQSGRGQPSANALAQTIK